MTLIQRSTHNAQRSTPDSGKWDRWGWVVAVMMALLGGVGCMPVKVEAPLPEVTLILRADPFDPWTISAKNPGQTAVQPIFEDGKYRGQTVWIREQKFLAVESADPEARNRGPWKYTVHDRNLAKFRITVSDEKLKLMKEGKAVETPYSPTDEQGRVSLSQP